jgi:hypothetical protein
MKKHVEKSERSKSLLEKWAIKMNEYTTTKISW